jgi:hypothetical protein
LETQRSRRTPKEAILARKEQSPDEQALSERRALIARQRYVLSRLHFRYRKAELPRDIEVDKAKHHLSGGLGIPKGPSATLDTNAKTSEKSSFQTRFFASHAWSGTTPCVEPARWRWGKRWKFMGRVSRRVPVAIDLPRLTRDPAELERALVRPIAGLKPDAPEQPVREERPTPPPANSDDTGCRIPSGPVRQSDTPVAFLVLIAFLARACARRAPSTAAGFRTGAQRGSPGAARFRSRSSAP